jgi:hypothetical protein
MTGADPQYATIAVTRRDGVTTITLNRRTRRTR